MVWSRGANLAFLSTSMIAWGLRIHALPGKRDAVHRILSGLLGGSDLNKIGRLLKKELLELLPPTIFFFIAFHILALFRALLLRQYGIPMSTVAGATVAALVAGEVVLIADALPFVNRFPEKPLMYNVVWKTLIYVVAALVVHYLEYLIPVWWRIGDLAAANRQLWQEIVWPHFWAIQLWLLVLFFMDCAIRELVRAVGEREVRQMFSGVLRDHAPDGEGWRPDSRGVRRRSGTRA